MLLKRLINLVLFFIFLSVLFCFPCLSHSIAAQAETVIRVDPEILTVGFGQVETLDVILENAQDVYGIELIIRFDPEVVEVVDSNPAVEGIQMIPHDFIKPDFVVRNTADNQAGFFQYVVTQVNPSEPVNGTGVILSVQFRGKIEGVKTDLVVEMLNIADRRGSMLTIATSEGKIEVVAPKPPTPIPSPTITETTVPNENPTPEGIIPNQVRTLVSGPAEGQAALEFIQSKGSNTYLILITIIVISLALLILLIALIVFIRRKQQKEKTNARKI